jgi:hypothetical protein
MLRQPWLDNYTSVNTRSSAIEQSQIRQRRFNDLILWGFKEIMVAPRYLLQFAVLLFAAALCCQLEGIDDGIGGVVFGIAWAGFLFYLCLVIRAAVFANCPYQTSGSLAIRNFAHLFRVVAARLTNRQPIGVSALYRQELGQTTILVDLQCISWALRWSLDDVLRLSAAKFLATMRTLDDFEPTLV